MLVFAPSAFGDPSEIWIAERLPKAEGTDAMFALPVASSVLGPIAM
jgi:hypothetical protein